MDKKRLLWIFLIGLVAIIGVFFWSGPAVEISTDWLTQLWPNNPIAPAQPVLKTSVTANPSNLIANTPVITPTIPTTPAKAAAAITPPANRPVMPIGANVAGQIIRNPFAPPPEASIDPAGAGGTNSSRAAAAGQGGVPALAGVIQGGGSRVAILKFGAVSRSYREGETAGAYKVAAIGVYSVTLAGPGGNIVLTMGQ